MKIVGIAGLPRSGKDSVAELFIQAGWYGVSFGDIVRTYSAQRHANDPAPLSVANMTETSNWLRQTKGPDAVLKMALKKFVKRQSVNRRDKGLVFWSIRAPVEVDFILSRSGQIIWVEASDKVRYDRSVANRRTGESEISLEEFKRQEALQWQPQPNIPKEFQMDLSYVKNHATKVIENNGINKDEFLAVARTLVDSIVK